MTQRAPHNAKLKKFASIIPAFLVVLLKRISSMLWPFVVCFSAMSLFIALNFSRRTSTDSEEISENILKKQFQKLKKLLFDSYHLYLLTSSKKLNNEIFFHPYRHCWLIVRMIHSFC